MTAAAELRNAGATSYRLDVLELRFLAGGGGGAARSHRRWANERVPRRHPFPVGEWARASRGGKGGLDHSALLLAGEAGFGFRRRTGLGRAPGLERQLGGGGRAHARGHRHLRGGELLLPSEVELGPGESYRSPIL